MVAPHDNKDGSASFTRFLAEHDVPCPRCGYNLRGLGEPLCPECGAAAGWGSYTSRWRLPDSRLVRGMEAVVLVGAGLAIFLLIARAPRAVSKNDPLAMAVTIGGAAMWLGITAVWLRGRARLADMPAHLQARWLSAGLSGLALFVLLAIAARVI
jgi:hypothetical protein